MCLICFNRLEDGEYQQFTPYNGKITLNYVINWCQIVVNGS